MQNFSRQKCSEFFFFYFFFQRKYSFMLFTKCQVLFSLKKKFRQLFVSTLCGNVTSFVLQPDQLKQQQLRQLKGSVIQGGQKTVIAQQLVTSMPQVCDNLIGSTIMKTFTIFTLSIRTDRLSRLDQTPQTLHVS